MLADEIYLALDSMLEADDDRRSRLYPAPPPARQPVHTVYVPAERVAATTVADWGAEALRSLAAHGPLPDVDDVLMERVRAKLRNQPIEDLRIDFEDGYGHRDDASEDDAARAVGTLLARGVGVPFVGLRIKSLEGPTRRRAVRTLDLVLESALTGGHLPEGLRVTLPKVTSVAQVEAMVELCGALEAAYGLSRLGFEIQIETPQAILGADGTALVARMVHASEGRCVGLHYGTYDYSASLGIAGPYQSMNHPVADHAKAVMQVAAAGTGVLVSDGSSNVLPTGNRAEVHAAWQQHHRLVRRSLERGFYQGWDLHPAQLPTRFAATFEFFRRDARVTCERLQAYLGTRQAGHLDEPATARAMAGMLMRGLTCGALDAAELDTWLGRDAFTALARTSQTQHGYCAAPGEDGDSRCT